MFEVLITIVVVLIVAALLVYLVDRVIPGDPTLLRFARIIIIVAAVLYICFLLLGLAGISLR